MDPQAQTPSGGDVFDQITSQTQSNAPQGQNHPAPDNSGLSGGDVFDQITSQTPVGPQQQPQSSSAIHNDEIKVDPNAPWYKQAGQMAGSVVEGIGQGGFKTVAGLSDIADKVTGTKPGAVNQYLHDVAGDNNTPGSSNIYNKVGYGGETLAEFMMGDEALKALSQSDKLMAVAKWMKIAEKSPRLMQALKFGATASKANAELSPEELEIVRQSPRLAKWVGLGLQAARAGVVQGAQTTVRTGGDVKQGAKDAGLATVTGGVLGAAGGAISGVAGRVGEAGKAAQSLTDAAGNASTKEEVAKAVGNTINTNEKALHTEYEAGIQDLGKRLGNTDVSAQANPVADRAKLLLSEPNPEDHPIVRQAGQAAGEQLAKPVRDLLKSISRGKLAVTEEDGAAAAEASKPSGLVGADGKPIQGEPVEPEGKGAPPYKINDLVQLRQTIRSMADGYQYGDINSRALRSLINGAGDSVSPVDQTIEQLANQSGDPSAAQDYLNLRSNYRDKINAFSVPVISKLREGKIDDAARDFVGVTSKGDALPKAGKVRYNTDQLRTVLGPDGLKQFGSQVFGTMLQDSVENSRFNPAKFASTLGRVSQETKGDLFDASKVDYGLQQLMSDAKSAATIQHLTRLGVLFGATAADAALASTGHIGEVASAGVSLVSMLGMTVAEGGGIAKGRELLDMIANHPKMWSFYRGLGRVADIPDVQTAAKVGRQAVTSDVASPAREDPRKRVYSGVKTALGGDQQ